MGNAQEEDGSEKTEVKTKAGGKKTTGGKTAGALKKQVQGKSQSVGTVAFALERLGAQPGEQSNVRIRRVWTSCSSKETRSRPRW